MGGSFDCVYPRVHPDLIYLKFANIIYQEIPNFSKNEK